VLTSELNRISNADSDKVISKRISVNVKLCEERAKSVDVLDVLNCHVFA